MHNIPEIPKNFYTRFL